MRARLIAVLLAAGACGQLQPVAQESPPTTAPAPAPSTAPVTAPATLVLPPPGAAIAALPHTPPPPLVLRAGGSETVLGLWSSCWSTPGVTGCSDGRPPAVAPDIGSPPEAEIVFGTPGWNFSASWAPTNDLCNGRSQSMPLEATGPTTHRLRPIGRAGDYTITLHGRSTDAATNKGDVATTLRWHTPADGPNELPSSTMSLLAARPGIKISLGAEFRAQALGVSTPADQVAVTAVVTAASGASMNVVFAPYPNQDCRPDGSVSLRSEADDGQAVAALGPAPYRYDVTLVLHGIPYRGTGSWPQDLIEACSPCTRLRWDPPLPALGG